MNEEKRRLNERKFCRWEVLPGGGRRYWHEVWGRRGWRARYIKEVDAEENTTKFWQEVYDEKGYLVMITRHVVARQLTQCLHGEIPLAQLVHWGEEAMMEEELDEADFEAIRDVIARVGLADVAAFGLTWEDCASMLARLGYRATVVVQSGKT